MGDAESWEEDTEEENWEDDAEVDDWEEDAEEEDPANANSEDDVENENDDGWAEDGDMEPGEEEALEDDPEALALPKCVALGANGRYALCWPNGQISWSGLGKKLDDLLTGRCKASDQDDSSISSMSFVGSDRYAVYYEGGSWQVCCDNLSSEVMNSAGAISCLSLGPKGSYIVVGSEGVYWAAIPKRANELLKSRNHSSIEWVALGTEGAYFLLFDDGVYYWSGLHPKLDILLHEKKSVHRVFLSADDWSYFVQLKDGRTFWNVSDEFDRDTGVEPQQAPGKKRKSSGQFYLPPSQIRFSHSAIGPVFTNGKYSIKDTFLSLHRRDIQPEDLPLMYVVQHKDFYVSISNRRLAVFRLLEMYGKANLQVPVELVQKMGSFSARYSTKCQGEYAYLRSTPFYIGRTREETNFDPFNHKLSKSDADGACCDSDADGDPLCSA